MDKQNYELAEEDYISGMKYKEIAEKYNVSINTVKSWKTRYKWCKDKKGMHTKSKKVCTQNKKSAGAKKNNECDIKEPIVKEIQNDELSEKQRLFVLYYVKYRNKTKAYMKAYNCSWINANAHAYEMWDNVGVKNEIDRQLKELRQSIKIDILDLIQFNIDIVFSDMKDYVDWGMKDVEVQYKDGSTGTVNVNYVDFINAEEVDGTIISEVKKGKDGVSIKLQDKQKAIDFLMKHLGYLDEETKRKLDIVNKKLQGEKLQADIEKTKAETNRITDNDENEVEDDGFLEALQGRTAQVWNNE